VKPPKKILVIRFSSIGDIVLTTPVIRGIKKDLPDTKLHFLTKLRYRELMESNPYIDKIHTLDKELSTVIKELKEEHFDLIIDLHNNLRTIIVKLQLNGKSYSVDKLNWRKWLLVNMKANFLPDRHIVDRYLDTVKPLHIENDGAGLDHFISQSDEVDLNSLPKTHQQGYIAFVIGAKFATKRLPEDKLITICKGVTSPIILLGDKNDQLIANNVAEQVGNKIFNGCGLYSINQSASLVKQSEMVISFDTGLQHIAAAYNKEIISLWGNTVPEFGMYPYYSREQSNNSKGHILEVKNLSCRPCSKIGYAHCPKNHFDCMRSISDQEVIDLANRQKDNT